MSLLPYRLEVELKYSVCKGELPKRNSLLSVVIALLQVNEPLKQ